MEPMNSQEQARQARVMERAKNLWEEGYQAKAIDDSTYAVTNEEGTRYEVSTLWETCSCPHFKNHAFCKHFWGLEKLLAMQAEEAQAMETLDVPEAGMAPGGVLW